MNVHEQLLGITDYWRAMYTAAADRIDALSAELAALKTASLDPNDPAYNTPFRVTPKENPMDSQTTNDQISEGYPTHSSALRETLFCRLRASALAHMKGVLRDRGVYRGMTLPAGTRIGEWLLTDWQPDVADLPDRFWDVAINEVLSHGQHWQVCLGCSTEIERINRKEYARGKGDGFLSARALVRNVHPFSDGTCGTCVDDNDNPQVWPCGTIQILDEMTEPHYPRSVDDVPKGPCIRCGSDKHHD